MFGDAGRRFSVELTTTKQNSPDIWNGGFTAIDSVVSASWPNKRITNIEVTLESFQTPYSK
jgi:hypothetical protein